MGLLQDVKISQNPHLAVEHMRRNAATPQIFRGWLHEVNRLSMIMRKAHCGELEITGTFHQVDDDHLVVRLEMSVVKRGRTGKVVQSLSGRFLLQLNQEGRVIATHFKHDCQ